MAEVWEQSTIEVGNTSVAVIRGGRGAPLLVLHDELGFPGWMGWNDELAAERELIIPLQPGYGDTPRVDWVRSHRDLGGFYARMLREQGLAPVDVVGFSAGGYIAAEMAAACPSIFRRMALVAPLGVRPSEGEIFDFLAVTVRTHVAATVSRTEAPEFAQIYGGGMTPEQFERFEDARAETARIGWEPFMFNPALPHLLQGVDELPTLLLWGDDDLICPRGCIDAYQAALPSSRVEVMPGAGHRPEIEDPERFLATVRAFLDS